DSAVAIIRSKGLTAPVELRYDPPGLVCFENRTTLWRIAKLLGKSQIFGLGDPAKFPAMFLIMLVKLAPGAESRTGRQAQRNRQDQPNNKAQNARHQCF